MTDLQKVAQTLQMLSRHAVRNNSPKTHSVYKYVIHRPCMKWKKPQNVRYEHNSDNIPEYSEHTGYVAPPRRMTTSLVCSYWPADRTGV